MQQSLELLENIKNFFRFFKDTQFLKEKMKKQNKKTQTTPDYLYYHSRDGY